MSSVFQAAVSKYGPFHHKIFLLTGMLSTRKIAWSKSGCIARITAEADGVDIYGFMYDREKKDYVLSEPARLELPIGHQLPIVHVSWGKSTITPDLVIVDVLGGLSIFSQLYSINYLRLAKFFPSDLSHDGSRVVGMEWLWSNLGSRAVCPLAVACIKKSVDQSDSFLLMLES